MFENLEPTARRELRERLQIDVLKSAAPEIAFFQEVNPVVKRAPVLGNALDMAVTFQPDLVGLKLLGLGLPLNLNSGLATLVARGQGVKLVEAVSLSRPGLNLVRAWGSWQLKEERFALFSETLLPKWGRVLLINTHLHHGLESTAGDVAELARLAEELELSDATVSELKDRLARGNERRRAEIQVLLEALSRHESRFEGVILAGDFNASPASDVSEILRQHGFVDAWAEANPNDPGFSFDYTGNEANHLLQSGFPLSLVVEDLSFSTKNKERLLQMARAHERRPRRIDYVYVRSHSKSVRVNSAELIGRPNAEGLAPSDHFGVLVDLSVS